jgi:DNA-binding transcriptional ArsR family regulator
MKTKPVPDCCAAFKALSNENRLKVFEIIRRGRGQSALCKGEPPPPGVPETAVCVCEILEQMSVTAPTLSHHLKELRTAGLVDVFSHGQWSYYRVRPGALQTLAAYFADERAACRR